MTFIEIVDVINNCIPVLDDTTKTRSTLDGVEQEVHVNGLQIEKKDRERIMIKLFNPIRNSKWAHSDLLETPEVG